MVNSSALLPFCVSAFWAGMVDPGVVALLLSGHVEDVDSSPARGFNHR